jgi:lipoprotein-anchoring transpeptidase ErfK/SrfK
MRRLRRSGRWGLWTGLLLAMNVGATAAHVATPPPPSVGSTTPSHPSAIPAAVPAALADPDSVLPADLRRQVVPLSSKEEPGTIIVDAEARTLYYVLADNSAIRYGVGAPREGFEWSGVTTIARKAEWPMWTPPAEMIRREPAYAEFASGMPGGPGNPLGARALYLYSGGQDTLYRIHGTSEPWTIGQPVSSGCFRMLNAHVTELYELVQTGAKVLVK